MLLADGDTFYDADIVGRYRAIAREGKNGVFFFRDTQPKPLYSYVTTDADGKILEVKEKVKISHKANTGCYCFASGKELRKECEALLAAQDQLSQDAGEYYSSGVIANMSQDKPFARSRCRRRASPAPRSSSPTAARTSTRARRARGSRRSTSSAPSPTTRCRAASCPARVGEWPPRAACRVGDQGETA